MGAVPPDYAAKLRADVPDITPAVALLALRVWARIHGLITLEIHGHLHAVHNDPAAVQHADLLGLLEEIRR